MAAKHTIEIITSFDPEGQKRYAQCAGSGLELFQIGAGPRC